MAKKDVNKEDQEAEEQDFLSINQDVELDESSLGSQMQPGIHENVKLVEIKYVTPESEGKSSWKGVSQEALDIVFEATQKSILKDENGNVVKQDGQPKIISRAGSRIKKREFFDPTDEKKAKNFQRRIKHIVTKFVDPEHAILKGKNLEEFGENMWKLVEKETEKTLLRLKVVMGSQGYGEIPGYWPFIQRMDSKAVPNLAVTKKEREGKSPASLTDLEGGMDSEIQLPGM
jgi:hypothetical protein